MMRKIFGVKNITHLLYGLILLLPFGMVFGRTIYTIANKNAKDSYYGETINNVQINELSSLHIGDEVYFKNDNNIIADTETGAVANNYITYSDIEIIETGSMSTAMQDYVKTSVKIGFYKVLNNTYYSIFFYNSQNNSNSYSSTTTFTIKFVITGFKFSTLTPFELYNQSPFTTRTYNDYSYLDNAFEYSLSQFTQDNNLGNVNFFSWFTNLFLDQTNAHNLVYLNFANWYMNYALLVSSGYLLFLCLLWFTNYVRRILDKSMNHDFGGF